jgi:hypothetical protein
MEVAMLEMSTPLEKAVENAHDVARNFSHSVAMYILTKSLLTIPKERLTISDIGRHDKEMASLLIANAVILNSRKISA